MNSAPNRTNAAGTVWIATGESHSLMKRILAGVFVFSWMVHPVFALDDNIHVSNLYDDSDPEAYWNVASSSDRQALFDTLSRDLGLALSHRNAAPGETLGIYGFELGIGTTIAAISSWKGCSLDDDALACQHEYDLQDPWRVMDADHRLTYGNALVLPTLRIRKGLPFSSEAGVDLSWLSFSHQAALSGYGRFAFHEGMWKDVWRVIPDVSLTIAGTRFLGNEELSLTTLEWHGTAGWTFPVGGIIGSHVGTFSPFMGFGRVYITSIPRDPLPERLSGLEGITGRRSQEELEPQDGGRIIRYEPGLLNPWKVSVGLRTTGGEFKVTSLLEFTWNTETQAFDRPAFSMDFGFIY